MAVRYHVNPEGEVRICRAVPGNCRYGEGEDGAIHGSNAQSVRLEYEKSMKKETIPNHVKNNDDEDNEVFVRDKKFTVHESRLREFEKKIEKANRRLEKVGITERFDMTTEERFIERTNDLGIKVTERYLDIELNTPVIALEGYEFQAVVTKEETGFITSSASNVDLKGWRPDTMKCDHCGQIRPRSKTFIIKDKNGARAQIGSSCVQAYLGVKPEGLWALTYEQSFTNTNDTDDDHYNWDSGGSGRGHTPVNDTLAIALAVSDGGRNFIPSSSYDMVPTRQRVNDVIYGGFKVDPDWRNEMWRESQKYLKDGTVKELKKHINELESNNDYVANLQVASGGEYVSPKSMGVLVSAVAMKHREERRLEQEKIRKEKGATFTPGHFGEENGKISKGTEFTVMENNETVGHDYYGNETETARMIMKDSDGKQIVWFASKRIDAKPGETVKVSSGTVKRHGEFNGVDQTIISRVRLLKD